MNNAQYNPPPACTPSAQPHRAASASRHRICGRERIPSNAFAASGAPFGMSAAVWAPLPRLITDNGGRLPHGPAAIAGG